MPRKKILTTTWVLCEYINSRIRQVSSGCSPWWRSGSRDFFGSPPWATRSTCFPRVLQLRVRLLRLESRRSPLAHASNLLSHFSPSYVLQSLGRRKPTHRPLGSHPLTERRGLSSSILRPPLQVRARQLSKLASKLAVLASSLTR